MNQQPDTAPIKIGSSEKSHSPFGFGGYTFGADQFSGKEDANIMRAMDVSFANGITHIDTATSYGGGHGERLIAQFLSADPNRRQQVFLASKYDGGQISAQDMIRAIDASRDRLQVDTIDLYYIHWPRSGRDMRPWMEGLETARQQGKIVTIGVSNFSVKDMQQVNEVGHIDAHQLPYSLLWRYAERDIIPYCVQHDIAVVSYGSIAHGILVGGFNKDTTFPVGDIRRGMTLFRPGVWENVLQGVEQFKRVAARANRSLLHLAMRWVLHQRGVRVALVSARNDRQAESNVQALEGEIADDVFDELTAISDDLMKRIPVQSNPYA